MSPENDAKRSAIDKFFDMAEDGVSKLDNLIPDEIVTDDDRDEDLAKRWNENIGPGQSTSVTIVPDITWASAQDPIVDDKKTWHAFNSTSHRTLCGKTYQYPNLTNRRRFKIDDSARVIACVSCIARAMLQG